MTVFLSDSIRVKPLPITNASILTDVTRLVTAPKIRKIFLNFTSVVCDLRKFRL